MDYYNENDPYCVEVLKNLIGLGVIADGFIDSRSIKDVETRDLQGYRNCHFFAGIGIWPYAVRASGLEECVTNIWTGSCPCQPFTNSGKRLGFDDERHLWPDWFEKTQECRPAILLGEQTADSLDWLDLVSSDLERADYAFGAADLCAAGFGAFHIRNRNYFAGFDVFADTICFRKEGYCPSYSARKNRQRWENSAADLRYVTNRAFVSRGSWSKPLLRKGIDADTFDLGSLHAYGNALDAETAIAFCESVAQTLFGGDGYSGLV